MICVVAMLNTLFSISAISKSPTESNTNVTTYPKRFIVVSWTCKQKLTCFWSCSLSLSRAPWANERTNGCRKLLINRSYTQRHATAHYIGDEMAFWRHDLVHFIHWCTQRRIIIIVYHFGWRDIEKKNTERKSKTYIILILCYFLEFSDSKRFVFSWGSLSRCCSFCEGVSTQDGLNHVIRRYISDESIFTTFISNKANAPNSTTKVIAIENYRSTLSLQMKMTIFIEDTTRQFRNWASLLWLKRISELESDDFIWLLCRKLFQPNTWLES